MMRRPRRSTLFPTPPLSRSRDALGVGGREGELAEPFGGDPRHGLRLARLDRARLEPAPEEVQDHGPIRIVPADRVEFLPDREIPRELLDQLPPETRPERLARLLLSAG